MPLMNDSFNQIFFQGQKEMNLPSWAGVERTMTEETKETKMREGPTRTYYKNWDYRSLQPIIVKQTPAGKPLVKLRMTDKFVPEV